MAITQSAKKALRQSIRHRTQNLLYKKKVRGLEKQIRALVLQKNTGEAKKLFWQFMQAADKASKVGVLKNNTASRKKSRLARLLSKAGQ